MDTIQMEPDKGSNQEERERKKKEKGTVFPTAWTADWVFFMSQKA